MTKRIAFLGAAGSGKSTLVTDVFTKLKKEGCDVELLTEWIRYDIQANGPMDSIWEQYRTFHHQRTLEDSVPEQVEMVLTDGGCLTPYFYACLYTKTANERERLVLADMFKLFVDDLYKKRYSHIFFLPGKLTKKQTGAKKLIKDGTRFQTEEELEILDEYMSLAFTRMFKVDNIYVVDVPLDNRADAVIDILLDK
jgi:nicotinamide riboside kinase